MYEHPIKGLRIERFSNVSFNANVKLPKQKMWRLYQKLNLSYFCHITYLSILGLPLCISGTAEATNFKFGAQNDYKKYNPKLQNQVKMIQKCGHARLSHTYSSFTICRHQLSKWRVLFDLEMYNRAILSCNFEVDVFIGLQQQSQQYSTTYISHYVVTAVLQISQWQDACTTAKTYHTTWNYYFCTLITYCHVELNVCIISVASSFNVFNLTWNYPISTDYSCFRFLKFLFDNYIPFLG